MTERSTDTETNWRIDHGDVEPIRIRDPVAEALGVLAPGDPFVLTYRDVVQAAGHSCPTAAGAYRIAQVGLDALYAGDLPVRSQVEVLVGGPEDDTQHGVTGRLLSYATGAAGDDGFGGLAGGTADDGGSSGTATWTATASSSRSVARTPARRSRSPTTSPTSPARALQPRCCPPSSTARPPPRSARPFGRSGTDGSGRS